MIPRRAIREVEAALDRQPAVGLLGPRQAGKTTLAHQVGRGRPSAYLDLELERDRAKLADPQEFFDFHRDRLVILDEIHRTPDIFDELRGAIDAGRREGLRRGRFLILGSASAPLLRQSESLAGRIAYVELGPLDILEVPSGAETARRLWTRGGLPESFLAEDEGRSLAWRRDYLRNVLGRDIAGFGPRVPAETLRRFWTMLAHLQGSLWRAARPAAGLGLDVRTVNRYLDLMADLLLARRLPPFAAKVGKRLVKSPKVYIRDSGLVHALLEIRDFSELLGHPVAGPSWEGFAMENLIAAAPAGTLASFYRTSHGAELDLVLELPGERRPWAVEVKRGAPRASRGFHLACADIKVERGFVVSSGADRYPMGQGVEAIGLGELGGLLQRL